MGEFPPTLTALPVQGGNPMEASDLGHLLGYVLPWGHTPSAGGEEDRLSRKKHAGRLDSQKASWLEVSPQGNRSWNYDEQKLQSPPSDT